MKKSSKSQSAFFTKFEGNVIPTSGQKFITGGAGNSSATTTHVVVIITDEEEKNGKG